MKTITFDLFAALVSANACLLDESVLVYPDTEESDDGDDIEHVYCTWEDGDNEFYVRFPKANNQTVTVEGTKINLVDSEGQTCILQVLEPKNLEE